MILENLTYVKEQNNQIITEIKNFKKNLPTKQEIQQLSNLLENNKPKTEIENKNLISKVEQQINNLDSNLNKFINRINNTPGPSTSQENDLEKITDALNKLTIEDIKINRKPKPYKHWKPRK